MSLSGYEVGPVMAVSDMDAAKEFYEGKLGLEPREPPGDDSIPVIYPVGPGALSVYLSPDHAGKSSATLAGWMVDDLEKVVDELTSKGVVFEQYDGKPGKTDEKGIIDFGNAKVAFMRDPDGNTHALNQMT